MMATNEDQDESEIDSEWERIMEETREGTVAELAMEATSGCAGEFIYISN